MCNHGICRGGDVIKHDHTFADNDVRPKLEQLERLLS